MADIVTYPSPRRDESIVEELHGHKVSIFMHSNFDTILIMILLHQAPANGWSLFSHFSISHKTRQFSSENNDRHMRDCGRSGLITCLVSIDPLGQPTVTVGRDHCFRTCCPSVRLSPLFKSRKTKQRKQCSLLRDYGFAEWIIDDTCFVFYIFRWLIPIVGWKTRTAKKPKPLLTVRTT